MADNINVCVIDEKDIYGDLDNAIRHGLVECVAHLPFPFSI